MHVCVWGGGALVWHITFEDLQERVGRCKAKATDQGGATGTEQAPLSLCVCEEGGL